MFGLIKLHVGLLKHLSIELKKKRTPKELGVFFRDLVKRYVLVMKEELKKVKQYLTDKEYRKRTKEFEGMQKLKKDLAKCLKLLQYVDTKMEKQGMNRQRRRQFWRDFYGSGEVRMDVFNDLLKELGGE